MTSRWHPWTCYVKFIDGNVFIYGIKWVIGYSSVLYRSDVEKNLCEIFDSRFKRLRFYLWSWELILSDWNWKYKRTVTINIQNSQMHSFCHIKLWCYLLCMVSPCSHFDPFPPPQTYSRRTVNAMLNAAVTKRDGFSDLPPDGTVIEFIGYEWKDMAGGNVDWKFRTGRIIRTYSRYVTVDPRFRVAGRAQGSSYLSLRVALLQRCCPERNAVIWQRNAKMFPESVHPRP